MTIEISDHIIAQSGMNETDVLLEIALSLYQRGVLPLGLAAQLVGLHRYAFQQEMSRRKIPVNLTWAEVQQDLENIQAAKISSK
jgi:predicted HTH domain antitoxin